jgi:NAD(P)-dependent dehydrogenase (short-subunit alcohol dehydrogenase family)
MAQPSALLAGKTIIVTGASRGMGRAMAAAFAESGASVTITASAARDELDETAAHIRQRIAADRVLALVADVTDARACASAVEQTLARFGRVDVLVNNAAKGARYASREGAVPFWQADPSGWELVCATNVNGPFHMSRAVVPHLIRQRWGRIINISKNVDTMHSRHATAYGPSKAALEAMTISWAQDLHGSGVTVNSLLPGGQVDTRFGADRSGSDATRLLPADVMVGAALWLASDASAQATGCRFVGRLWDTALTAAEAAERAREMPAFRPPARPDLLALAWQRPSLSLEGRR